MIDNAAGSVTGERARRVCQAGVASVQCGCHKRTHVNLRALPKQNPVWVDQVHLSIGIDLTQNLGAVGVINAVDCNRRR